MISETILALCNDGTVWEYQHLREEWVKFSAIPQPLDDTTKMEMEGLMAKERKVGLNEAEKELLIELYQDYQRKG